MFDKHEERLPPCSQCSMSQGYMTQESCNALRGGDLAPSASSCPSAMCPCAHWPCLAWALVPLLGYFSSLVPLGRTQLLVSFISSQLRYGRGQVHERKPPCCAGLSLHTPGLPALHSLLAVLHIQVKKKKTNKKPLLARVRFLLTCLQIVIQSLK